MRVCSGIIGCIVVLAILSSSNGFLVHGKVPASPQHTPCSIDGKLLILTSKSSILTRGGQSMAASGVFIDSTRRKGLIKSLTKLLTVVVDPAISGGLLSGGLHAITGPDHLAALIAPSVGKSGFTGLRIGALWGIGHGASAILLGLTAFFLKGQFTGRFAVMEKLATAAESVVGLSILFIGLMGIRESLEQGHEEDPTSVPAPALSAGKAFDLMNLLPVGASTARLAGVSTTSTPSTPFDASTSAGSKNGKPRTYAAIVANGMLHGFSWDGAPSLAPAIAMSSWRGAFTFLLAYSLGTIVTMSLAAGAMGELSTRVGQATNNPDLPRKLSLVSSVAAVLIGVYMTAKSTILR